MYLLNPRHQRQAGSEGTLSGGLVTLLRVPTPQGKQGKWPKRIPLRENTGNLEILSKHREFCLNTGKTQGILLAQVVNVLILKVKDTAIVAAKKNIFPEAG